jgi:hypothetical protein
MGHISFFYFYLGEKIAEIELSTLSKNKKGTLSGSKFPPPPFPTHVFRLLFLYFIFVLYKLSRQSWAQVFTAGAALFIFLVLFLCALCGGSKSISRGHGIFLLR